MSGGEEQVAETSQTMSGRRVDFGKPGEGDGLAWGIEVDIDLSDSLVRARFQETSFKLPKHITKIKYLELSPQEALPPEQRTIRSKMKPKSFRGASSLIPVATPEKPGNEIIDSIRRGFNLLKREDMKRFGSLRAMVTWVFGSGNESRKKFEEVLDKSKGDTLVIVHGHSSDMSGMGEQYPDETRNESGNVIQRKYNFVPMDDILDRYNDPDKFAAVVLHGCNTEKGSVEAKKVPVFYPMSGVKTVDNPGFVWGKKGGASIPTEQ